MKGLEGELQWCEVISRGYNIVLILMSTAAMATCAQFFILCHYMSV